MTRFESFSVRKAIVLVIVVIVSLYVGLATGNVISSLTDVKMGGWPPPEATPALEARAPNFWSGTIRKIDVNDSTKEGSYKLVGDGEKIVAVLTSQKIDLSLLNGMPVRIEGRRLKFLANNLPLVQVDKVKF